MVRDVPCNGKGLAGADVLVRGQMGRMYAENRTQLDRVRRVARTFIAVSDVFSQKNRVQIE